MAVTQATELADFSSGIGTEGAILEVDNNNNRIGIGTTNPQALLQVGQSIKMDGPTGVITATSFSGSFTGNSTGLTGTPDITVNNIVAAAATFTGEVTYEDVTNIDSIGIVTARAGVDITGGSLTLTDSIIHSGDTNTKVRFPSADTFTVETAGVERFRVGSTGTVGVTGLSTATSFGAFNHLSAPFGGGTVTFTVTVASKTSDHRYNGSGSGNAYLIDGVQAPFLTLTPGRTYRFTNDNTGSHPLKFYLEANKTNLYTTGVTFDNAYTEIVVSDSTPTILHYQCTNHSLMGNAVQVNSNISGGLVGTPDIDCGTGSFTGDVDIADKIIHTGDTNTAIRFPAADTFTVETGGTERLRVDSTGDVGLVGIATATGLVVVAGSGVYAGHAGVVTAVTFDGNLSGNVTGAATQVTVADESSDTTCFPLFATAATGNLPPKSGTNLTFNSSSGALTATSFVGALTGNVTGNISGGTVAGSTGTFSGDVDIADKIVHTGDTNTAIRFPAGDTFSIETGATEALRVDSAQKLLINTTTSRTTHGGAAAQLQIEGTNTATAGLSITRKDDGSGAPTFVFGKTRNGSTVDDDDNLGAIYWQADDGTDLATPACSINAEVDGTPGSNNMPGRIVFSTQQPNDVLTERLRISSDGKIRVSDGSQLAIGTGNDMLIHHNSLNSIINNGTGDLFLMTSGSGDDVNIQAVDDVSIKVQNGEQAIKCIGDGAVELYHDNSKRLDTTADGVDISGTGSIKVPVGTTAQRNSSPTAGDFRYNSDEGKFEGYTTEWGEIGGGGGITTTEHHTTNDVIHLTLSDAQDHKITATGICTIFPGGGVEGESHTVRIINSGIATVGFSTQFLFPSGSEPVLPTASGAISLISFTINKVGVVGIATELLAGASVNFS